MRFSPLSFFAALIISVLLIISITLYWRYEWLLWVAYLITINGLTILTYGYDKLAAGTRFWRVPEKILHYLAVFGGSPAALVSQLMFRHKTTKHPFKWIFRFIVLAQIIGLILLWVMMN